MTWNYACAKSSNNKEGLLPFLSLKKEKRTDEKERSKLIMKVKKTQLGSVGGDIYIQY